MPDIVITPATGKLEFVDTTAQATRRHSFTLDATDGVVFDAPFSASSVTAPLNIINVTVNNSNVNYPFVLAASAETGPKALLMDGAGGTYNPSTNTATIDISGNSATTTLASNSSQLNGQAASYYTNIPARLGYTPVNQAGDTITGNFTVNGNFTLLGNANFFSASNIYITSSVVQIDDNIITLNAFSPYLRYAGIEMYDSGSGTLSQFLWDGQGDYFFLSGSGVNGKIITGPDSQADLSANYIPKATGGYKLGNSLIQDNATTVTIGGTTVIDSSTPATVLRLKSGGSTIWTMGVTDAAGSYFNITADFGSLTINKTNGAVSSSAFIASGTITANSFTGAGTGLTGTAANLTAGTVTTNANLTGDVTSTGNATTIANSVVTYAKIQNVSATSRILGRVSAGAGVVQELAGSDVVNVIGNNAVTNATNATNATTATTANSLNTANSYQIVNLTGSNISASGTISASNVFGTHNGSGTGLTGTAASLTAGAVTNGVYTNANNTLTGLNTFSNGLALGNRNASYTFVYGGAQDLAWKKVADITIPSGLYRAITFKVDVIDTQGNFGWNSDCYPMSFFVSCRRSGGTQDSYNDAYVTGPVADYVRAVKVSTGVYELQIRQLVDWQIYLFTIEPLVNSGGCTVTYAVGINSGTFSNGTTNATNYLPTADWTQKLAKISGSVFSGAGTGLTGTAAGLSIGGNAAGLSSTLAIGSGGTGATTAQAAMNALAGGVVSGQYLRGNGTNVVMSAIQAADVPTLNQNTTGNAATATSAGTVSGTSGQLASFDNRTISPNETNASYLQFGFTSYNNNNSSPWADYLHLRSYGDSSGGNDNLVMFRKDAIGMRIYQQTWGSASAYASSKDVCWTDGTNATGTWNITSSWATNAVTALNVGNGTITIAAGTGIGVGTTNTFTTNQSGATTVTVTNNGVTSNVAGTGISVSGATGAVTITNSGVTSLAGTTNQVSVSAGTGGVTLSLPQNIHTSATPTFSSLTTSVDGANLIMAGTSNAEGIRMTPANSTTYPVFLRSINPGVGEASPWIYKEQATDWGIWHNNPVNSIDFTKQGSGGIASNVGGSASNTVTVRVEMATGYVQTIAGYRNSAGTTILSDAGNITGTAAGETLGTVTGRGGSTGTQIVVATAAGQAMYIGRQAGAGYAYGSAGIFTALSDNPNGGQNIFYQGYISSSASTPGGILTYSVRADGQIYTTMNSATGVANNSFNVGKAILGAIHIANGPGTTGNNNQAAITFQGGSSSEAQAGIYVSNNSSTGTAMGFATTDSYATGPQLFMTATNTGVVNFPRARPTYAGNALVDVAGGQTIAGITYFSNGESMNVYGIRGRFTNEYLHLYNKVGVGHSGGWGQGEGSTPDKGLSTYGGLTVAYGNNANAIFYGNVGVGTTTVYARVESYYSSNAITFNYLATNLNNNSPIPVYGFDVTNGVGETRSIKAGIGYERHLTNGRGAIHFYNASTNDTQSLIGTRTSAGDIKMTIQNDGNVGIGYVQPSYTLAVNGTFYVNSTGYFNGSLTVDDNLILTAGNDFGIYDSDGTGAMWQFMDSGVANIRVDDGSTGNGKLSVNSGLLYVGATGGNVGIGTTSPNGQLHIYSSTSAIMKFDRSAASTFGFEIGGTTFGLYDHTNSEYRWRSNSRNLIINESYGNLGIGTTSPGYKLHFYNSSASNVVLESGTSGTTGKLIFKTSDNSDLNKYIMQESYYFVLNCHANEGFIFRDSSSTTLLGIYGTNSSYPGRVGIGTTAPGQKLDVEGRIRTRGATGTGGFEIGAASTGTAKWRIEWDSASDSLDFNWVG